MSVLRGVAVAWTTVGGRAALLAARPARNACPTFVRGLATVPKVAVGGAEAMQNVLRVAPRGLWGLVPRRGLTGSASGSDAGGPATEAAGADATTASVTTDSASSSSAHSVPASDDAQLDAALWLEELTNQKTKSALQVEINHNTTYHRTAITHHPPHCHNLQ